MNTTEDIFSEVPPEFHQWAIGFSGCYGGNLNGDYWFCGRVLKSIINRNKYYIFYASSKHQKQY